MVTILYAIVGIPLMLLFLSNIGDAMAQSFKFLYWKVCCILCVNPRKSRKHRRRRRRKHRRNVEQMAVQTLPTSSSATAAVLYPSIPRTTSYAATRQSHIFSSHKDASRVPIICNKYALQGNPFEDMEQSSPIGSYLNRPFATLNHFNLQTINSMTHLNATQQTLSHTTSLQQVVQQEDSDYSTEGTESDTEIDRIPNVPITLCIALVVSYVCGGGFLFQFLEKWSFLDSSYFCFVTLTTIGFGDLVPEAKFSREDAQTILGICALYLLFGMALLAMSFNLVKEEVTKQISFIGKRIGILTKDESDYESD